MRICTAGLTLAIAVAVAACESAPSGAPAADEAAASDKAAPMAAAKPAPADSADEEPAPKQGLSGRHRATGEENEWVPAEFTAGMSRFKDTFVYADGVPVGVLDFAEIPVPLEPVWTVQEGLLNYNAKRGGPQTRTIYERRYRFVDYFKAIGLPVGRIKEVHLYGGSKRRKAAAVIPGNELRRNRDAFMFRFGGHVRGKALPSCPVVGWNCPDTLTVATVYIDKPAPKRVENEMFLDGKPIEEIPYIGEPLRGGIRITLDNRYVTRIKRRALEGNEDFVVDKSDDKTHWNFFGFLQAQDIKTDNIVEAWIVNKGEFVRRLDAGELSTATFTASLRGKGEILLGWENTPTSAIHLYTKARKPGDLPVILPHEKMILPFEQ